jgi:hypothetical protein
MHHHHVSGRCVPVSKCVSRAFSDRPKWRIGLPTETSPLSTHLFPTSPDGQDLCRLLHRSLPILNSFTTPPY